MINLKELISLVVKKAYANVDISNIGVAGDVNLTFMSVANIVKNGITIIVAVAGVLFFIMLLIGGVQYVMSGGDKTAAEAAKSRITHALIGIVIVAAAFAIVELVTAITGVNIRQVTVPNAEEEVVLVVAPPGGP